MCVEDRRSDEYLPYFLRHVQEMIFVPVTASAATEFMLDTSADVAPNRVVHFVDDNRMGLKIVTDKLTDMHPHHMDALLQDAHRAMKGFSLFCKSCYQRRNEESAPSCCVAKNWAREHHKYVGPECYSTYPRLTVGGFFGQLPSRRRIRIPPPSHVRMTWRAPLRARWYRGGGC